jgi:ribosomal protein S18 acetylase RimI-like enzyme
MAAAHDLSQELASQPAGNRGLNADLDRKLLSRAEDAGLNASAPPQQLWIDGWLVRFSPGKAKRARCINALASGRLSVVHKLARAEGVFAAAQLPMVVRITPFTRPSGLDAELAARGFGVIDDTRVMVAPGLAHLAPLALPRGFKWQPLGGAAMAQAVGALRGSPLAQRQAHAERLANAPVPFRALAIKNTDDGAVVACGQCASEGDLVGVYDVFVDPSMRGRGLAAALCTRLLSDARQAGAKSAYLQVEADNAPARAVYFRLGFTDGYGYHYRMRDA